MPGLKIKDRRLLGVVIILIACLSVVIIKLFYIQVIQAEKFKKLAGEQRNTEITITQHRGTIFDREGEILAISEDVTTVYATPYQVKDKGKAAHKIANIIGDDPVDVLEKLETRSGFVYIARKIDNKLAEKIRDLKLEGIGFIEESKRFYPGGKLAAQILGIVDMDNKGQAGLELYYEEILGGKPGSILLERDAAGNQIPGSEKQRIDAVDGIDIQLSIDKDIQLNLEEVLTTYRKQFGAKAGTAMVLDCNNGDVLAMATEPGFDPNDRETMKADNMRNRSVTDVYEPGSVLKVVTATAALQEGVVTPESPIACPSQLQVADQVFKEATPQPSRTLPFSKVISQSSNVGTIQVGLMLGKERHAGYLKRFGLGSLTGIDFPGEVGGIVPPVSSYSGTSVATISIGQGISITPIQLGCVLSTIANGGYSIQPHFLKKKIGDNSGKSDAGGLGEKVIDETKCAQLTKILELVVAPGGTGSKAAVNYYRVAGKTGTAAKPNRNGAGYSKSYMASFAGFSPAEDPRLAVVVVFDEPSPIWGGSTSAPVFSEIMGFSLQHLGVTPSMAVTK